MKASYLREAYGELIILQETKSYDSEPFVELMTLQPCVVLYAHVSVCTYVRVDT